MKTAVYTRAVDGQSLDRPIAAMEQYIATNREEGDTFEWFTDTGEDRPAWRSLLEGVHNGRYDRVLAYPIDKRDDIAALCARLAYLVKAARHSGGRAELITWTTVNP